MGTLFLALAVAAQGAHWPVSGYGGAGSHPSDTALHLDDDIALTLGATSGAPDAKLLWDTSGTHQLKLWLTDCDGGGTDCVPWYIETGTQTMVLGVDLETSGKEVTSASILEFRSGSSNMRFFMGAAGPGGETVQFTAAAINFKTARVDIEDSLAIVPSSKETLAAGDTIASGQSRINPIVPIEGSGGAVTLTSTPSMKAGALGNFVIVQGMHDTNTVTIQDDNNLSGSSFKLQGDTDITLGSGDTLTVFWCSTLSRWVEVSRSDN